MQSERTVVALSRMLTAMPSAVMLRQGSLRTSAHCVGNARGTNRPDGRTNDRRDPTSARGSRRIGMDLDKLLDAAETVVARQGIASLTLDAVATEAHVSKGGLLHHFPTKDRLVEALVRRCAEDWRARYTGAYEEAPAGPGRMARALVAMCLGDDELWTERLRRSSSAVFAALAQNPALIEPMRVVYADLHRRIAADDLPPGVGEVVVATIDGLWLNWVLGLVPIDEAMKARLQQALAAFLAPPATLQVAPARAGRRR